jgi:hypothetical protein
MTATPALPVVGWIVLTRQADGTWLPDWDGIVHTDRAAAEGELDAARARHDLICPVVIAEVRGVLP